MNWWGTIRDFFSLVPGSIKLCNQHKVAKNQNHDDDTGLSLFSGHVFCWPSTLVPNSRDGALEETRFFFLLLFRFFSFLFVFFFPLFPLITLSVCSRIVPTGFVLGCLASAGSLRRSDAMWEQAVDACDLFTPPA